MSKPPYETGYRFLNPDEIIVDGDQFWFGSWKTSERVGICGRVDRRYRRKIQMKTIPGPRIPDSNKIPMDSRYRELKEGEMMLEGDEFLCDGEKWTPVVHLQEKYKPEFGAGDWKHPTHRRRVEQHKPLTVSESQSCSAKSISPNSSVTTSSLTMAEWRKERPLYEGLFKYFPKSLRAVSHVSWVGNNQHNPGQPLAWLREKSSDHEDCLLRHLLDHIENPVDDDGELHLAKVCWRSFAALETYLEEN